MSSVESSQSLLIPPNPSLSPTKPSASILLNGNGRSPTSIKIPSPPRTTTPLPQTSSFTSFPLGASSSSSSSALSRATSSPNPSSVSLTSRRSSTTKISFAPLPTIPNELKRRNSISIGVASRKHLISGGGGGGEGGNARGRSVNKLMMSDAEWEDYKKHYDEKSGNDPIDLGELAMQGCKNLWGKVKRRSSSASSASSSTSSISTPTGSTSNTKSSVAAPALSASSSSLGTVDENEEHHEPIPIPSSDRRGSLRTIPGSPPPSIARSVGSESSPSTTTSTISDTESDFGEAEDRMENITHPSYTPGNRIATFEASQPMKNKLLNLDGLDRTEDGERTPRRLPSPPPRKADIEPLSEESAIEEEEEEEGRRTPGRHVVEQDDWTTKHREKKDRTEILGFDPDRFGRALNLATKNGEIERR
ncbi:uncharacterized protein L201_007781 [Kwoniella dendrophila CBS 6074]|uniref:Uncharacterized protein n=1 Tax=Kwoniella dendrophila CBS 6074 TaxID=1295534 RepID=A0AAX4K5A1_9TREE